MVENSRLDVVSGRGSFGWKVVRPTIRGRALSPGVCYAGREGSCQKLLGLVLGVDMCVLTDKHRRLVKQVFVLIGTVSLEVFRLQARVCVCFCLL